MRIVYILKDNLNKRPPILSVCQHLLDSGHELTLLIRGISEETRREFEEKGAKIILIKDSSPFQSIPQIGKMISLYLFHRKVTALLKKLEFDYVWVGSADATLTVGKALLQYKFILQIQELYDQQPRYRKGLAEYMRKAALVFVPEQTRAEIFRAWYSLKKTPTVLPNKPYYHPRNRNLPITVPEVQAVFDKIPKDAKIVLYQGGVSHKRDLKPIARAIEELGEKWALVVQCPTVDNEYFKDFIANYKFYRVPYVPAPKHLEITSHVHLGLVTYTHISLNNEFCAPNKIWEYSGFGLPMIGNDVSGLTRTIGNCKAGVCMNLDNITIEKIKDFLLELEENYETYSKNATAMYDALDVPKIIKGALESLGEKA